MLMVLEPKVVDISRRARPPLFLGKNPLICGMIEDALKKSR